MFQDDGQVFPREIREPVVQVHGDAQFCFSLFVTLVVQMGDACLQVFRVGGIVLKRDKYQRHVPLATESRMVACIEKTGGVVDKFIGDAIMGVWGAPVSAGTPRDDALAAVRAMLMMRDELLEFNKGRGTPEKPFIHNGAGVNTGPVIAGQIGSLSRMEYTVIGDAVNLASRIETLNKPFGTDVLISEYTWDLVKDAVIAEPMPAITVKGKTAPLTIYAVVKMKGDEGPGSLSELREKLGIADPGKKIEVDKEEVKYEIVG